MPDGAVTANPLIKISLDYLKTSQLLFLQLRRFVEENGTLSGGGEIDTMELILRRVQRKEVNRDENSDEGDW